MTVTISLTPKESPVDDFGDEIEAIADDIYMNPADEYRFTKDQFVSLFAYNNKYSPVARMVALHLVEMKFEGEPSTATKKVMTIVVELNKLVASVMNRNGHWTS